jgi:hypothetical protein
MLSRLEFAIGLLIWCGVLWDGFATIVLPRTVAPMRRVSGRFYRWSWRLWAAAGRGIRQPELRLSFLAVYGPLSVMLLLLLWAGLMIFGDSQRDRDSQRDIVNSGRRIGKMGGCASSADVLSAVPPNTYHGACLFLPVGWAVSIKRFRLPSFLEQQSSYGPQRRTGLDAPPLRTLHG